MAAAAALSALVPTPAKAEETGAPHDGHLTEVPEVKHVHHDNHFTVGVEGGPHGLMAQAGVFHEVAHNSRWSCVVAGSTLDGRPTGAAEIVAAYHKTVRGKLFAVLEAGGGVDFLREEHGVHTSPMGRLPDLLDTRQHPTLVFLSKSYCKFTW